MLGLGPISSAPIAALESSIILAPMSVSIPVSLAVSGAVLGRGAVAAAVPVALALEGAPMGRAEVRAAVPLSLTLGGVLGGPGRVAGVVPLRLEIGGALVGRARLGAIVPAVALALSAGSRGSGRLRTRVSLALLVAGAAGARPSISAAIPFALSVRGAPRGRAELAAEFLFAGLELEGNLLGRGYLGLKLPIALSLEGDLVGLSDGEIVVRVEPATKIRVDVAPATVIATLIEAATEIATSSAPTTVVATRIEIETTITTYVEAAVEVGDKARFIAEFKVNGTLTDPTTVKLVVRPPKEARYELVFPTDVTKLADGRFAALVPITETGTWRGQWVSTGAAAGAKTERFTVDQDAL